MISFPRSPQGNRPQPRSPPAQQRSPPPSGRSPPPSRSPATSQASPPSREGLAPLLTDLERCHIGGVRPPVEGGGRVRPPQRGEIDPHRGGRGRGDQDYGQDSGLESGHSNTCKLEY